MRAQKYIKRLKKRRLMKKTFNFKHQTVNFSVSSHHQTKKIRNKGSMSRLLTVWNYIRRYKYLVAVVVFLLIIGVLDENSLYTRYQRRVEIGNLKQEIQKYQSQYEAETAQLQALQNDPSAVERMARERYFMKRPDEDVFVFVTDSTETSSEPSSR